jgi:hypothetical protein
MEKVWSSFLGCAVNGVKRPVISVGIMQRGELTQRGVSIVQRQEFTQRVLHWPHPSNHQPHNSDHNASGSFCGCLRLEIPDILFHATERLRALILFTTRPIDQRDHVQAASSLLWRYMCGANLAAIWTRRLALLSSSDVTRGIRAPSDERRLQQGMCHISVLLE